MSKKHWKMSKRHWIVSIHSQLAANNVPNKYSSLKFSQNKLFVQDAVECINFIKWKRKKFFATLFFFLVILTKSKNMSVYFCIEDFRRNIKCVPVSKHRFCFINTRLLRHTMYYRNNYRENNINTSNCLAEK